MYVQHLSLTMFIWVVPNENVKQAKILWTITDICLNPKSVLELEKIFLKPELQENLMQILLHGLMKWKVI